MITSGGGRTAHDHAGRWQGPALALARRRCKTRIMVTDDGLAARIKAAGFAPCFPVRDIETAPAHYEELGFDVMPYTAETGWAWVRLGTAELHLFVKDGTTPRRPRRAGGSVPQSVPAVDRPDFSAERTHPPHISRT
jgi:hypothetical protein